MLYFFYQFTHFFPANFLAIRIHPGVHRRVESGAKMEVVRSKTIAVITEDQAGANVHYRKTFKGPENQLEREIQALRHEKERLMKQNTKLSEHIFALDGPQEYATPSELQMATEIWYSAIKDFCLRVFDYSPEVDTKQLCRTWKSEKFELLRHHGMDNFHHLATAWLFELLEGRISQHFMVGICESMGPNGPDVDASLLAVRSVLHRSSESSPSEYEFSNVSSVTNTYGKGIAPH
jgi:hypothetical protein